jgi:predicted translation initiation factor SUI1
VTRRAREGDVLAFLGPSLSAEEARRISPCRVLPPARAGDVYAALPSRPLAIALVDGLFDASPSVWHRELLAALDAGVAVFGGGSMGALRAAELAPYGVVGVGRVFGLYRDGIATDDSEVALLHAGAEHGWRAFTVPLVAVRAAAEAARAEGLLDARDAARLVRAAAGVFYGERTWARVLDAARFPRALAERLRLFLPGAPDPKAEDARAVVAAAAEFARARRRGAPPPPRPTLPTPPSHARRRRLAAARSVAPAGETLAGADVLAALGRRKDAGALAVEGLRRLVVAALGRAAGLCPTDAERDAAERAWLGRLGIAVRDRERFLAASGLDDGEARGLVEDLALEAAVLDAAERLVADGPAWEEGLARAARLSGAWAEEVLAMAKRSRPEGAPEAVPGRFNDAFAKLRERLPAGGAGPDSAEAPAARPEPPPPARAVVRLERKGRGGKEVTVVEKLALTPNALAAWADALKRSLGCGGTAEDGAIVLQGDQRERARKWLEGKGVRKVVAG